MQSQANDVQQYLKEVPAERLEALQQLRELCQATLDGYDESMEYGMPSYSKNGVVEVAFASQKNYISLYILKEPVLEKHRPSLQGLNLGKGCIRYSKPEKMDFDLVKRLLEETLLSDAEIC
jgi:uncharacterized protein YdhG (YjbR/CyaY superfamily)